MTRPTKTEAAARDKLIGHAQDISEAAAVNLRIIRDRLYNAPLCAKKAEELDNIIRRLEAWQR